MTPIKAHIKDFFTLMNKKKDLPPQRLPTERVQKLNDEMKL